MFSSLPGHGQAMVDHDLTDAAATHIFADLEKARYHQAAPLVSHWLLALRVDVEEEPAAVVGLLSQSPMQLNVPCTSAASCFCSHSWMDAASESVERRTRGLIWGWGRLTVGVSN